MSPATSKKTGSAASGIDCTQPSGAALIPQILRPDSEEIFAALKKCAAHIPRLPVSQVKSANPFLFSGAIHFFFSKAEGNAAQMNIGTTIRTITCCNMATLCNPNCNKLATGDAVMTYSSKNPAVIERSLFPRGLNQIR